MRAVLLSYLAGFLLTSVCAAGAATFSIVEHEADYINVLEGKTPVLRYVRGEVLAPDVPEHRRRSTYVHPIYSPDGLPLTDDFPRDHRHHRGLSWMWQKVRFDGVSHDLWTLRGIHQRYVSHEARAMPDRAVLRVMNAWIEDSTGRRVIDETVTITPHAASADGRIIDVELRLAAMDTAVDLGVSGTGYSGLNLRFGPRSDTAITTSKGPISADQDRKRYAWADLSGRFNALASFDGIAIFDHPSNPHFPCGWTLRFYGDLNSAFTSTSADYTIRPGSPLVLRYRLYVHRGKADPDQMYKMHRRFIDRD